MKTKPLLRHIANLWTLQHHPSEKKEWSLERKIAEVKAAGFDGFTTLADASHAKLAQKHGLIVIGYFASAKQSDFKKLIQQNLDAGAIHINVQLADHDTPVEASIKLAVHLNEIADKLGAKCAVEVHRDTCTETPEKTYAIAAGYKKITGELLPMTWDFSHLSIIKHLNPPYWDRLLVDKKLIQRAQQFHFRPFNGHHCQVPVTNGKGGLSVELKQWLPFLDKTLETWLAVNQSGREIFVCPEMGPVHGGYNFAQLPSGWEDAKILRSRIATAWKKALATSQSPPTRITHGQRP